MYRTHTIQVGLRTEEERERTLARGRTNHHDGKLHDHGEDDSKLGETK